jgi:hypothetical protein
MALVKLIDEKRGEVDGQTAFVCVVTLLGKECRAKGEKMSSKNYGVFDFKREQIVAAQAHGLKVITVDGGEVEKADEEK